MKCSECTSCRKGWFKSKPDDYVCIGVSEPFVIKDINVECTEYHENRSEVVVMNTAEMWLKAQKDDKTYENINGDMAYSKKYGLVDKNNFSDGWNLEAWSGCGARGIDALLECEWQEMNNVMTIEEAELKFGIKIIKT